jgi:hypothetical protein
LGHLHGGGSSDSTQNSRADGTSTGLRQGVRGQRAQNRSRSILNPVTGEPEEIYLESRPALRPRGLRWGHRA